MIESREGGRGGHVGSRGGGCIRSGGVIKSRASKWLRQG